MGVGRDFRLGYIRGPGIMALVLEIARDKGFFQAEGIQVCAVPGTMGDLDAGLASGSLDMVRRGPDADMLASVANGGAIRVAAVVSNRPIGELLASPQYRAVNELRGKPLAVIHPRLGSTAFLRHILWQNGLGAKDLRLETVGTTPARYEALKTGLVSGAMLSPPESWQAKQDGFRVLASLPQLYPAAISTSFQINESVAKAKHGEVVGFLRALVRSHRWVCQPENKQAVLAGLQRLGYSKQQSQKDYAFFIAGGALARDCAASLAAIEQMVDLLTDIGEMKRPAPRWDYFVDPALREEAVSGLD